MQVLIVAWLKANWISIVAVAIYLLANVYPRPPVEEQSGATRKFWFIVDRLCFLTAQQVPGRLKWPLMASPWLQKSPASTEGKGESNAV